MSEEELALLSRAVIRRVAVRGEEERRRYLAWLCDAIGVGVEPPRLTVPLGVLAPEFARWRDDATR
ncbi:MAG: hypothetical protein ACM3ZU_08145 [Bacteroidota bacterium]